jgi:hypothetical protein
MRPRWPLVAAALLIAGPASAQTTETKEKEKTLPPPADAKHQLVTGVIVKAEPGPGPSEPEERAKGLRTVRLTINTAAVWRDWVRDQAETKPGSPKAEAARGERSVATAGEPRSAETLTTVVVAPTTLIETRFRSSTDEVSEGARTPGNAARVEAHNDPADTSAVARDRSAGRPARYTAADLRPGLWIEVHYKDTGSREKATLVRVMRPIGGPDTPAADEKRAEPAKR